MSRAFAPGESEDDEERFLVKRPVLPPGTPNYITPTGAAQLEAERERLIAEKTALSDSVEAKQRAKVLDQHLSFLTDRLNSVHILDPLQQAKDRVLFGATVTLQVERGLETYRIVGIDEVDLSKGWISWISPLARALLDKAVGETALLGARALIIKKIEYT